MMKLSKKSKYAWLAMAITASLLGGSVVEAAQTMTDFTTPLTGNSDNDIDYEDAGVLDGSTYTFSKESTITVSNADAISVKSDVTINAISAPLHINAGRYGVLAGKNSNLTINAKDLNVSVKQDESKYKGSDAALIKSSGKLTINGDINGTIESVTSQGNAIGIMADNGELTINGNVTMKKDGGWGISYDTKTGWEPVGIYATGDVVNGGKATINGLVDMTVNGTALETMGELSEITVKGGHFISNAASDNRKIATLGMLLVKGTINLNVNEDKTDAGDAETVLVGDISLQDSNSHVNFGLSTKDSKWTGVADNDKGSNGTIKLYLKNGATWENAVTGQSYGDVSGHGSYLTTLSGGSDTASTGNIFMKDTHDTTVEKYSGYTNVYYAHTGSGESTSDYTAGNFIIKSAAEGASISLITDNTGVNMDSEDSVKAVLNALAGKLTYSGYIDEVEKNLTGYVKIADGLTASSKALQTGNIDFSKTDGKGSLAEGTVTPGFTYPEEQVKDTYTRAITGITKDDYIYKQNGVLKEEGKYTFTKDPTKITVEEGSAINAKADITIDTSKAKLELSGKDAGIKADGHQVSITGSTVITGEDAISASHGGKVTLNGMTDIKASGEDGTAISVADEGSEVAIKGNAAASITGAVYVAGGNLTVNTGATTTMTGDVLVDGGKAGITLGDKASTLTGNLSVRHMVS